MSLRTERAVFCKSGPLPDGKRRSSGPENADAKIMANFYFHTATMKAPLACGIGRTT
jgi:hypothetical protein